MRIRWQNLNIKHYPSSDRDSISGAGIWVPEFFLNIAVNLGKRLEHNCSLIRETEDLLSESKEQEQPLPPKERTNYKAILALARELERFDLKYKNEWLTALLNKTKKRINDVRELWK